MCFVVTLICNISTCRQIDDDILLNWKSQFCENGFQGINKLVYVLEFTNTVIATAKVPC